VVTAGICIGSGGSVGREGPIVQIGSALASQALRQLEVYGRDGLPVVSADGRRVEGWITSATVLRGLARQITGTRTAAAEAEAARSPPARPPPGGSCKRSPGRRPAFPCHCCADAGSARQTRASPSPKATASAC
jgi:hypothetical protein